MKGAEVVKTAKKGDQFMAYSDKRPAHRVYIEVTRVAKDGSWADIRCFTWAVMWTKRQKLPLQFVIPYRWTPEDMKVMEDDHMAMLRGLDRL